MDTKGSLPPPQQPAICSCPEPHYSCPPPHIVFNLYFNIILPSTPTTSKRTLSYSVPHRNLLRISHLPLTCYMLPPIPSSLIFIFSVISDDTLVKKLLTVQFPVPARYVLPIPPKYLPQHLTLCSYCYSQWRTQGGGVQQIQLRTEDRTGTGVW